MPNRVISTKVSTERGEVLIKAAQAAGLPHSAVTTEHPYRGYEGEIVAVEPGKMWVIVETGDKKGSDRFHKKVGEIEAESQTKT